jgi:hypothetical protein
MICSFEERPIKTQLDILDQEMDDFRTNLDLDKDKDILWDRLESLFSAIEQLVANLDEALERLEGERIEAAKAGKQK